MYVDKTLTNFILITFVVLILSKFPRAFRALNGIAYLFLGAASIGLVFAAVGYLFVPSFLELAEGNISAVGAYWSHGGQIYTPVDSVSRYSLLYGPWPYLCAAFFQGLYFGWFEFLAKVPGLINLFIVLFGFAWMANRHHRSQLQTLAGIGLVSISLLGHVNYSYWNRPDSYLMAYAFLAFLLSFEARRSRSSIYLVPIGALIGLAINCKIHGFLYFIPSLGFLLDGRLFQWKKPHVAIAVLAGAVALTFPFLLSGVDVNNYREWVKLSSHHGLSFREFIKNCTYILSFVVVGYLLKVHVRYPKTAVAFLLSAFLVSIFGCKIGAGIHHFIPLLPVAIWLMHDCFYENSEPDVRIKCLVIGFVLALGLNAIDDQKRIITLYGNVSELHAEFDELRKLSQLYPEAIELGFAEHNLNAFTKSWLAAKTGHLWIEGSGLTDMVLSNLSIPQESINMLVSCRINGFLIPKRGDPWKFVSSYNSQGIFPDEFKSAFLSTTKILNLVPTSTCLFVANNISVAQLGKGRN